MSATSARFIVADDSPTSSQTENQAMSDAILVLDPTHSISPLQQAIIERSQELCRQQTMNPRGNRFHYPILVNFAVLAFIHGGRKFYEMLHANFQGIFPSIRIVGNRISRFRVPTKEAEVYVTPVKQFIEDNKLPPVISISEDATAIVGRREYWATTNSIFGFSLPLQPNGLPKSSDAEVGTVGDIINMFKNYDRATSAMVVMAQPLCPNAPAFEVCSFGTNNKFTSFDVENRRMTIENEFKKVGITVLTYSADGDSKEMKMMRDRLQLGIAPKKKSTFTNLQ